MGATGAGIAGSAVSQGISAYSQIQARKFQSDFEARQLELNAEVADLKARQAKFRGEQQVKQLRSDTRTLIGSQRASFGAQGIDIESGSALQIQEETAELSALDEITLRNNAMREAFGHETQALSLRSSAGFTRAGARIANLSTISTAGLNFGSTALNIAGQAGAFSPKVSTLQTPTGGFRSANPSLNISGLPTTQRFPTGRNR